MHGGAERPAQLTGDEIRRRISDITRLRLAGHLNQLMGHFSQDVIVHYNCTKEGLFSPGVLNGRAEFHGNLRLTEEEYQGVDGEIADILVEGNLAAVRWRTRWRHRGTGVVYRLEMAYFLRWKNDVVIEMHEFLDIPGATILGRSVLRSFEDLMDPRPPGLTREEILERVRALADFPSPQGMDIAAMRKYCSPDIVCEFVGDRVRIPYAGRHIGVDAITNIVRSIGVDFEQLNSSLSDVVIDGGRAACRRTVEWRHCGTGRRGLVALAEFLKVEDGLIVELIEYRDSITILEMQGEMESR